MFDIGFTEMMLISVVALVVIGPERLPGVARTAGKYVGRLKRFMTTVKADVEQELRADELREILSQQQKELDSLKDTISDAGKEIEKEANVVDELADTAPAEAAESDADKPPASDNNETAAVEPEPVEADTGSSAQPEPAESETSGTEEPTSKTGS